MAAPKKSKPASPKTARSAKEKAPGLTMVTGGESAKGMPEPVPGKKRVLHVGCGYPLATKLHQTFRGDDWQEIRVDIDPAAQPDIVADMTDMHMVKDGEVEAIWSSHNLEHLYAHQVPVALKEFYRVIKQDGFLLITMPDIQKVAQTVAEGKLEETMYLSPAGPITALDVLFGFGRQIAAGNHFMAHRTGFTAESLGMKLRDAGFSNIQVKRVDYDLWAIAHKIAADNPRRMDKIKVITPNNPGNDPKTGLVDELDRPPVAWSKPKW